MGEREGGGLHYSRGQLRIGEEGGVFLVPSWSFRGGWSTSETRRTCSKKHHLSVLARRVVYYVDIFGHISRLCECFQPLSIDSTIRTCFNGAIQSLIAFVAPARAGIKKRREVVILYVC